MLEETFGSLFLSGEEWEEVTAIQGKEGKGNYWCFSGGMMMQKHRAPTYHMNKAVNKMFREAINNSPMEHQYNFANRCQIADVMAISIHIGDSPVLIDDRRKTRPRFMIFSEG
ncbi:hypothetical protein HAX54_009657 [Datura stramonium]|uniref:Uncharacterized protein n=1 Tax=Datura stramonium TaxID=4076 RepID=A0ABS8WYM8_DATST|nr:hypothetical protein [Datura stramonium]